MSRAMHNSNHNYVVVNEAIDHKIMHLNDIHAELVPSAVQSHRGMRHSWDSMGK